MGVRVSSLRRQFLGHAAPLALAVSTIVSAGAASAAPMITTAINDAKRVVITGNVRPEVATAKDLGAVPDSLKFDHLMIQLKRSPEQQKAFEAYVDSLNNKLSPNFHQWLTPTTITERFGLDPQDLETVKSWLAAKGFTINAYLPNQVLDVGATAGQIRAAFGVNIHHIQTASGVHIANIDNPKVPEALAGVVLGPVSLHDFRPHAMRVAAKGPAIRARAKYNAGGGYQAVVPADLATIYNINPLWAAGITGLGQTIAVVEDSDLYSNNDFNTFRKVLGLSRAYPHGSLTTLHPAAVSGQSVGGVNDSSCTDPGDPNSDDSEAALDVEWSSAAAPNAAIQLLSCKGGSSRTNPAGVFGGFIAMQNALSAPGYAKIFSISYGESEESDGATANAYVNALFSEAASYGVSVFVSSGDEGATSTDAGAAVASHGINITGWGGTPYNVSVGGNDFGDTAAGTTANYWNTTNNPSTFGSAKSYIPEIPWNDSCASALFASSYVTNPTYWLNVSFVASISGTTMTITAVNSYYPPYVGLTLSGAGIPAGTTITATQSGFSTTTYLGKVTISANAGTVASETITGYVPVSASAVSTYGAPAAVCNTSSYLYNFGFLDVSGGSGGPSACATGTASTSGVASGTCAGYAKPSWQSGIVGNPSDNVRDIPDVSLFASNGQWNHYYVACYSNATHGGTACGNNPATWAGFGGTSISSPIMAAIQAMVNEKTGQTWGNPNPIYYGIAKSEYGASGSAACNSSASGGPASTCVFYDVTQGDMVQACKKSSGRTPTAYNCDIQGSNTYGLISTSNTALSPNGVGAYGTTTGWDFATGIGSVNAYNLVNNGAW